VSPQQRSRSSLSLVERPDPAVATPPRSELKFELHRADVGKLDDILRVNHRPVVFAGRESIVHSIYFDDARLGSYVESVDGVGLRAKIRLRWYDSPLPERLAFFEVKRRRHELIEKDRYVVTCDRPLGELSYRELIAGLLDLLPPAPRELLAARPQPVVLIRYRRRHYHARRPRTPVRITIDHQVAGSDQVGASRPRARFATALDERVILEAKAPPGWGQSVRESLHPLRLRRTRCSKYLLCCDRVGRATGAACVGS
jgi:hypothetical protein